MDTQAIFSLQFALSLVAWGVVVSFPMGTLMVGRERHEALLW